MTPNKGEYSDTHRMKTPYVHPSGVFFDNVTNGPEITLAEIERRAGGHIIPRLLTSEMAKRGFERSASRGPAKYVRRSWYPIDPYHKPEVCSIDDITTALDFHKLTTDVSWRNIVAALGYHPRRKDVEEHLNTLGYTYDRRRARWDKATEQEAHDGIKR